MELPVNSDRGATLLALADAISQFAWVADAAGSIYWYNQRWYDYTGTTLEQMYGWGWRQVHHPDHVERVVERIRRSFETGEPWEDTFPLRARDGTYRWFLSRALPVRNSAGEITHWFGTNTDVTEQRALADEHHANSQFLKKILESSSDCIKVLDLDGSLRFMSEGALKVMEVDDFKTIEGCPWPDFWQGALNDEARAALETARNGGVGHLRGEAPTLKGTKRWWDVRVTAIQGADGKPERLLSISRDITSQYLAENIIRGANQNLSTRLSEEHGHRETAEAQVRQLQKMEAVGRLTGGIAHDFNNMLAVIISALNLLERRLDKGENVKVFIDGAVEAAQRAATLTQRLLAFSRQLPLAPELLDPNRVVTNISEMARRVLGEATPVETVTAGGIWKIHADPGQLENAILNLAINARDAMPEGGKLTIETSNCHLDDEYARAHDEVKAGQYVMIAVSDTGSGMDAQTASQAFDPFFTTKGVGKGTGLGLSQVYGFVKQSRGHVKIYSEVGSGTSVKIYLPRLESDAEIRAPKAAPRPIPTGSASEVILLVDDEERMRDIGVAALRELGYTVLSAASGRAALRLLAEDKTITMLFTDIVMPDMNGRELANEAVRLRPDLKVLFTTGYTRNAVVHGGVLDSDVNFLAKPFTLEQLGQKLRDVISSA